MLPFSALPRLHTSILWRVIAQAVLLSSFIIVTLATVLFLLARATIEEYAFVQLSQLSAALENHLDHTLSLQRERAVSLAASQEVQDIFAGTRSNAFLQDMLREQQGAMDAKAIAIFDRTGRPLASVPVGQSLRASSSVATTIHPVITREGWNSYDIVVPIHTVQGQLAGFLQVSIPANPLQQRLISSLPSLGPSAELILSWHAEKQLQLLIPAENPSRTQMVLVGGQDENRMLPAAKALNGEEFVDMQRNHRGKKVLAAYRFLPLLGWGLSVEVEEKDVFHGVKSLAASIAGIGILLTILAALLASLMAQELTHPLRSLASRVRGIGPGRWRIARLVQSTDEVGELEATLASMSARLQRLYENLEEEAEKRAKELRKLYALDRAILHAVEHGIVTVDSKGAITGVNPAAAAILKRSQKELLGTPVTRTLVLENKGEVLPDQQHPATLCLRERRAIHPSASSRLSIACHDDSKVPALLLATPLFQEKKLFGAVIVFQDVHDERLVEELKSEFITLASHQLRTPLAIVRWHADILGQGKKLTMEQQQSIGEMNTALTRMTNLINTLMQVAKLEEGNINPTMESVDICGLLKELCHEISLRAREAGVEMKLSLDRCPCPVPTDPSLIAIVFQNLLGNAVQYTPAGGSVTLSLDMDRSSLLVSVSDTGVGIPARERSRIFEKFFRAQNAQRLWTAGSGLGLYISRMIIERLGGTLSFRTQEGKGSTFIVCLPRAENQKKKRARR